MNWMDAATNRRRGERLVRWILVVAGLLGVAAGIIVLAEPANALATLAVVTGIFLIFDGIFATAASLFEHVEGRHLGVLAAVISVIIGVILIRHPVHGVLAIGFLLGLWLIAAGVVRLAALAVEGHLRGWWTLVCHHRDRRRHHHRLEPADSGLHPGFAGRHLVHRPRWCDGRRRLADGRV